MGTLEEDTNTSVEAIGEGVTEDIVDAMILILIQTESKIRESCMWSAERNNRYLLPGNGLNRCF